MKLASILMLSHEFPPLGGGAGRNGRRLCEELHARGIAVEVWTSRPPNAGGRAFPFPVVYFPTGRRARFETSPLAVALYCVQALVKGCIFARKKPGLIFSNIAVPTGIVCRLIGKCTGVPYVVWHHGADVHQDRPEGAGLFFRCLLRFVWKKSALNLFVSEGLLTMARTYGRVRNGHRLSIVPDSDRLSDAPVPGNGRMFLFAGRLESVKNPLLLVDAIALVRTRTSCSDCTFMIVGSGRLFPAVKKRIRETGLSSVVTLLPSVDSTALQELYRSSYAFIITSRIEGFGATVLEAALHGVPSIGSDTVGIREAIRHQETGLLFKENSAGDLALSIERLALSPSLRNDLGDRARTLAQSFTIQATADCFLDFLGDI
jgi:glycosyltransferase involved in cell wall biosynthesis